MKTYAFRLRRAQDLRKEIDNFVKDKNIQAGVILTCVGNLEKVIIRMADENVVKTFVGTFEIVSLVGTVECGNSHIHISISDKNGHVFGGHLKMGSRVGVTSEIVIGELEGTIFKREIDNETGFEELVVN
jgi:predicted DNA-binding protein with PD1-like motif